MRGTEGACLCYSQGTKVETKSSSDAALGDSGMGFLKRLMHRGSGDEEDDPRPVIDWLGNDESAKQLGRVEFFDVFLEDVREVAPDGSVLVLEGKPVSDVREVLELVRVEPEVRIARGTIWPKDEFFHIPATRENIDRLLDLTLNHAVPEICDHVVLYREQRALLWLHDAGDGYVYGHPALGDAQLQRVRSSLKQKTR